MCFPYVEEFGVCRLVWLLSRCLDRGGLDDVFELTSPLRWVVDQTGGSLFMQVSEPILFKQVHVQGRQFAGCRIKCRCCCRSRVLLFKNRTIYCSVVGR